VLKDYGLLTAADAALLATQLSDVSRRFPTGTLNILEIGIHEGKTARAIARHLEGLERSFQFFGVDNGKDMDIQAPFVGAVLINGDSADVYNAVPNTLHLAFIDGCHCINHVALDYLHYGRKVVQGGILVFHDTGALMQGKDYQHGPDMPDFYAATRRALDLVGIAGDKRWRMVAESDAEDWGGCRAYERV